MKVTVAWASPAAQGSVEVELPAGASVADAVRACDALTRSQVDAAAAGLAIFGQTARPSTPLRDGDRVEITRPLVVDAKAMRRARARSHPLPPSSRRPRTRRKR